MIIFSEHVAFHSNFFQKKHNNLTPLFQRDTKFEISTYFVFSPVYTLLLFLEFSRVACHFNSKHPLKKSMKRSSHAKVFCWQKCSQSSYALHYNQRCSLLMWQKKFFAFVELTLSRICTVANLRTLKPKS